MDATQFTTTRTVPLDTDALCSAIDGARAAAAGDARWSAALERAYQWAIEQEAFTFTADDHLVVPSATEPGKRWEANGTCSCPAAQAGRPCWHRAACRLIRRMVEHRAAAERCTAVLTIAAAVPAASLGQRLAAQRARVMREIQELFA